jgi:hypothetical protein
MKELFIIFLSGIFFFSCVDEERMITTPVEPPAREKSLVLTMQIPGTYLPVTYAYSETDENDIRTVDALVFRVDASGNEYYYRHIASPAVTQEQGNIKKTQLRLELIDSRVIVLANVRNLFTQDMEEALRMDSIRGNVTKKELMQRFVFTMHEPFGKEREAFPMYGESTIIRASDEASGSITMIRAITRIDIVNGIADDKMTIDSVFIFHTKNKGYVAPGFTPDGSLLGLPNVPAEAEAHTDVFGYRFVPNAGVISPAMEREIYLTEDGQDREKPTILVVKMLREGQPAYYYRVDILDKEGELLPIQRNCRYRINLVKILSEGYLTAAEAAVVPAPSLSSTVETNELGISTVVFNDHFKLGVSTADIVFGADGSWDEKKPGEAFYSLKVHTTYSGWSASWDEKDFAGWLEFPDAETTAHTVAFPSTTLTLRIKVNPNATAQNRSGKIRLTAGTLRLDVNVTQYSSAN